VDSLEFSEQEALSASTKLTKFRQSRGVKVCRPSLYRNAYLVISFLQEKGLEKPQIKKLIYSLPVVLTTKIETNLEPKMNYFLEMGASVSDFADIIVKQPTILSYALDSTIHPAVEALREVMGSNENVWIILKASRLNSLLGMKDNLVRNVSFLRARCIPLENIRKRILENAVPFIRKHEAFKDIATQAEVKWGLSPTSLTYLVAVHVLCCINERSIESKCRVFESFGWDRSHVVSLFRRSPRCFGLGERNIKAKLSFYMNELGYGPGRIAANRSLLGYSLEKRLMPRHLVFRLLKEKGLIKKKLSLPWALALSEDKFLMRFILPFLDDVPNLYDIYVGSKRAATKEETVLVSQE